MKKKINYFIIVICVVFILSFLFLITSFAYSSIKSISAQGIKAEILNFKKKENDFRNLEKSFQEWKEIETTYNRFKDEYLIKFEDFSQFRNELQSMLRKNELKPVKMDYQISNFFKDIVKVGINFTVRGNYKNIKRFSFELENKIEMIVLQSINLVRTKTNIVGQFKMEVYFVR